MRLVNGFLTGLVIALAVTAPQICSAHSGRADIGAGDFAPPPPVALGRDLRLARVTHPPLTRTRGRGPDPPQAPGYGDLWPPALGRDRSARPPPRVIPDVPGLGLGLPDSGGAELAQVPAPPAIWAMLAALSALAGLKAVRARRGLGPE